MIWNKTMECMSRPDMEQYQSERLREMVERVYHNVAFYRHKMQQLRLSPDNIKTIADLRRLPFTVKTDLRDNYPYGLFAVPLREVVRIHTTTETIDTPTVIGYTRNDLKNWAGLVARFLTAAGVTEDDVIQISFSFILNHR